jgi:predicted esterase
MKRVVSSALVPSVVGVVDAMSSVRVRLNQQRHRCSLSRRSVNGVEANDAVNVERVVRRLNRRIENAVGVFEGVATPSIAGARAWSRKETTHAQSQTQTKRKLLLWFHGFGDVAGASWEEFCRAVIVAPDGGGSDVMIACPDAPMRATESGVGETRAWFEPRLWVNANRKESSKWTCDGIEASLEMAVQIVNSIEREHGIPRHRVVLGGFSQGACLALACARSELRDVAGVLAVRGYLPNRVTASTPTGRWPETLILAGGRDPLVPTNWSFEAGRATGAQIVIRDDIGHELCVEDVYRARRWMRERFDES